MLLCNDLGTKRDPKNPGAVVKSNGHGSISVKEAVRVAQSNNFMGLVCNSRLLVRKYPFLGRVLPIILRAKPLTDSSNTTELQNMVPALVDSIKVAGLVLVTDTSEETPHRATAPQRSYRMPDGVDGILKGNGVLRFHDTIDM